MHRSQKLETMTQNTMNSPPNVLSTSNENRKFNIQRRGARTALTLLFFGTWLVAMTSINLATTCTTMSPHLRDSYQILGQMMENVDQKHVVPESKEVIFSTKALAVLELAPVVDLAFASVPNRTGHPHMGAFDENGHGEYVPDITLLHQNPPEFGSDDCQKDDVEKRALSRIHLRKDYGETKILCAIYSSSPYHEKLVGSLETWAPQCDGFFVASNKTDPAVGAINIPHVGEEKYDNMWQKVRSIWSFIYHSYYNDYDWFHLGGDDMHVIVDNLRAFLTSDELQAAARYNISDPQLHQKPLYLGQRFENPRIGWLFNTGGPGYTINKAALKLIVTEGLQSPKHSNRSTSMEDVVIGKTLREMGVEPYPTTDHLNRQRYHHISAGHHYASNFTKEKWYQRLSYWNETGGNMSSTESISFHYVDTLTARRYHALLHGLCNAATSIA